MFCSLHPTEETDASSPVVAKHRSDCVDTGLLLCLVGSSIRRSCILMILLRSAASSSLRPTKDKAYLTGAPAVEMSTWALLTLSVTSSDMCSSDSCSVHPAGGRQRRMDGSECEVTGSCGSNCYRSTVLYRGAREMRNGRGDVAQRFFLINSLSLQ